MNVGGCCHSQMMADRMNGVHGANGSGQNQQPSACDQAAKNEFEQMMNAPQSCQGSEHASNDMGGSDNMQDLMAQLLPLLMQLISAIGQGQTQGSTTQQPHA
jgi:hypothetical protein